jgi:hypothetical protein
MPDADNDNDYDLMAFLATLRPLPDEVPAAVRMRKVLLRQFRIRCEDLEAVPAPQERSGFVPTPKQIEALRGTRGQPPDVPPRTPNG